MKRNSSVQRMIHLRAQRHAALKAPSPSAGNPLPFLATVGTALTGGRRTCATGTALSQRKERVCDAQPCN